MKHLLLSMGALIGSTSSHDLDEPMHCTCKTQEAENAACKKIFSDDCGTLTGKLVQNPMI